MYIDKPPPRQHCAGTLEYILTNKNHIKIYTEYNTCTMYVDKPVGHLLANLDVTNGAHTDRVVQPLADPCVHLSWQQ